VQVIRTRLIVLPLLQRGSWFRGYLLPGVVVDLPSVEWLLTCVTPDFPKKTKCISYVCQDQVYTHMINVMSEISINNNKSVQELNHYIIPLLHSDARLEGLYNDQTITMKMQLHLHLPHAHDWGHASLRNPRSR
jgi:hypothetical protein